ncbi:hypothetical protein J6590_057856 [Homalodisca vitripennis]|nr:hypothetical protein J6590_057856 [Homalodisca vitripennis]
MASFDLLRTGSECSFFYVLNSDATKLRCCSEASRTSLHIQHWKNEVVALLEHYNIQDGYGSAILSSLEQPSKYFDLSVRCLVGEWNSSRLYACCRGPVPESAQSGPVSMQSLL